MGGPVTGLTYTARLCALACLALGVVVMVGWVGRFPLLVQLHESWVPMQFNTALGFVLTGAGLGLLSAERLGWSRGTGALLVLLGGLTLTEYVGGLSLGIDEFFFEHYIITETSHPGRMAPNTALSFVLAGGALALAGAEWDGRHKLRATLGAVVGALGLVALIGYAMSLEPAYGWSAYTRMAAHTAAGFLFAGTGLVALGIARAPKSGPVLAVIPPLAGGIVATGSLWQALSAALPPANIIPTMLLLAGLLLTVLATAAAYWMLQSFRRSEALEVALAQAEAKQADLDRLASAYRESVEDLSAAIGEEQARTITEELRAILNPESPKDTDTEAA